LIAPTEPLPLTSDEPSMQSILDSDSWKEVLSYNLSFKD
jgi:hypothetical protein